MKGLVERLHHAVGPAFASLGVAEVRFIVADDTLLNEGANLLLHHPAFSRHTQEVSAEWLEGSDLHEILL